MIRIASFFLLLQVFSPAYLVAQKFLYVDFESAETSVQLPQANHFQAFQDRLEQEIPLGKIEVSDEIGLPGPIRVTLRISGSLDWHLRFYLKKRLVSYLYFNVEKNESHFKGMMIAQKFRGKGLSKLFFKYYVLFCDHYGLELGTAKILKPLMSQILMGFGYHPADLAHAVFVKKGLGLKIDVFPVGFSLEEQLIQSQKMNVLDEQPDGDDAFLSYVQTSFTLPIGDQRHTFWEKMNALGGRFYLFKNADS